MQEVVGSSPSGSTGTKGPQTRLFLPFVVCEGVEPAPNPVVELSWVPGVGTAYLVADGLAVRREPFELADDRTGISPSDETREDVGVLHEVMHRLLRRRMTSVVRPANSGSRPHCFSGASRRPAASFEEHLAVVVCLLELDSVQHQLDVTAWVRVQRPRRSL
ncbi:MAG TPA: hypothetical protein VK501_13020 [Baekduia sp.]|uniref:hypothetical protein n=1 Tax=Baekduia sp. TaxID=2600305 RepID=UPI002C62578E|nr:hypothetical protein [Baekduia sp.]HMJ34828.1 hypothetical protein [Baekduia sp.]